jgi:hypothetical protein
VIGGPPLPEPIASEFADYARLLQERYEVEVNVVAGCVVTHELDQYVNGYNAASERLLQRKHGLDVVAECKKMVWPE